MSLGAELGQYLCGNTQLKDCLIFNGGPNPLTLLWVRQCDHWVYGVQMTR